MFLMTKLIQKPTAFFCLYSKLYVLSILLLIFVGAMVKSTDSGLAVPDWPLSYGMLFPPMIGGIFYEHGHRIMASFVGFLTLTMLFFSFYLQLSSSIKKLSLLCLGTVLVQGLLGGITVLFYLPTFVSLAHGMLAQTFLLFSILFSYTVNSEHYGKNTPLNHPKKKNVMLFLGIFVILLYIQLFIGAYMRHTNSGLALYDFPRHAGYWIPRFNEAVLEKVNDWRFEHNLDPVSLFQVILHFSHRLFALVIVTFFITMTLIHFKTLVLSQKTKETFIILFLLLVSQIFLGAMTIWSGRMPFITSLHLSFGAILLGNTLFLFLRVRDLL